MWLEKLFIESIRNLKTDTYAFHRQFNLLIGPNGSGKTSLLESIYLLATGRSFRASQAKQMITFNQPFCVSRGTLSSKREDTQSTTLAVVRDRNKGAIYKLNEKPAASLAELTKKFPVQLINNASFELFEAGPGFRRALMDWGAFYQDVCFFDVWQRFKRALKQRNAALKQKLLPSVKAWDKEFIETAESLDHARKRYLQALLPLFNQKTRELLPLGDFSATYHMGWPAEESLIDVLQEDRQRDLAYGFTHHGPHRADLSVTLNGVLVDQVLSRGQLKLLIAALYLARAELLFETHQHHGLFLLDDLMAELDKNAAKRLLKSLEASGFQVFITGIEEELFEELIVPECSQVFHVEHGTLTKAEEIAVV